MFALGMHFRREKERQEAEKRKARVAAERARKKTIDGSEPSSRHRPSVAGGTKATTSGGEINRERAQSQPKRYSYPAATVGGGEGSMTRSTDDFGKLHIQGPPPPYDSLTNLAQAEPNSIPYPPDTYLDTLSLAKTRGPQSDDLVVPVEPKKVKKSKVSKSKSSSTKSPKLSAKEQQDLTESTTSITKNGISSTTANITPLVM